MHLSLPQDKLAAVCSLRCTCTAHSVLSTYRLVMLGPSFEFVGGRSTVYTGIALPSTRVLIVIRERWPWMVLRTRNSRAAALHSPSTAESLDFQRHTVAAHVMPQVP